MAQIDSDEQLWLFPFRSVVRTMEEFLLNLYMSSDDQDNKEFTVELQNMEDRNKFIERALAIGAYVNLQSQRELLMDDLVNMLAEEEKVFPLCKECNAPAIYYMECSCGTYAWCKEHEDTTLFYDHADHECSPECCERRHAAQIISAAELEASIPTTEVLIEEQPLSDRIIFSVQARRLSEEEHFQKLEQRMMHYSIKELAGKLKNKIKCNLPPLEVGQKVEIIPHFMSSPTLALAVVRLNQRLVAQILAKRSDWDYTLLLPEGIIIPGHSKPYDDSRQHSVVLSRSEIELI